mmetsp:Transcript_35572/g.64791  ORF Transcript_35572/g.64791 Transcript_35572/m.64791 type:complete len:127 (-) Transcript_35572:442-822(-)
MTTTVRRAASRSIACCTRCSEAASRAEVASSSSSRAGSSASARATATRCFWPPERRTPRSPTRVAYLSGNSEMKSWQLARRAMRSISGGAFFSCSSPSPREATETPLPPPSPRALAVLPKSGPAPP